MRSVCHRGVFVFQLQKKEQHKKKGSIVSVSVPQSRRDYSVLEIKPEIMFV